jgi:hypothetical protein
VTVTVSGCTSAAGSTTVVVNPNLDRQPRVGRQRRRRCDL